MTAEQHDPQFDLRAVTRGGLPPEGARLGLTAGWQPPALKLADYQVDDPPVPLAVHRSHVTFPWWMMGNGPDPTVRGIPGFRGAGCCMIAAMYRVLIASHLNADTPVPPVSSMDVLRTYGRVTGYQPADTDPVTGENPTDQGTNPADAITYWAQNGLEVEADGSIHRILGSVFIDPTNVGEMRRAVWEFGDGIIMGALMPATAEGRPAWDVTDHTLSGPAAPGSWGGHAFNAWSYDPRRWRVGSWNLEPLMTDVFRIAYLQNAVAVLTTEALNATGVSAAGFDIARLASDLKDLYA